jgi:hypothetical protein
MKQVQTHTALGISQSTGIFMCNTYMKHKFITNLATAADVQGFPPYWYLGSKKNSPWF